MLSVPIPSPLSDHQHPPLIVRRKQAREASGIFVQRHCGFSRRCVSTVSFGSPSAVPLVLPLAKCSKNYQPKTFHLDESDESHDAPSGLEGEIGKPPVKASGSNELMRKLRRYGIAGVLSYGLLNTIYYLTTFLLVWFYFAPAPGRMGYSAAVERFCKLMAMIWAGSQVTKVVRAGGALALAPFVDKGLSWFTVKFNFESKGKAFAVIACLCFAVAFLLFTVLTLLWA